MLLAVDIGNTTIALGVFEGKRLVNEWRARSEREKTADEYGILLLDLLRLAGLEPAAIDGVIISSVVPPLTPVFQELGQRLFGRKALVVGPGLKTGMPILYENPGEVGADRVVASLAAFEKHGGPCIVVDFGTATTFDSVTAKGEYLGGAIAPGIQISAEALYLRTAKLPRIEVVKPKRAIGKTTVASMQSGIYFGYVGLVNHLIAEIGKELGGRPVIVVTGGFAAQLGPEIRGAHRLEPHLVLEGLRIIYDRNAGDKAGD
ncbi:MAG: pantothenate kinase [Candidatus Aminicenantes bacterium RBG_16_63_16]|nr:MAG: pantothenate kinase [Candidatus Aminicenantes bacterium RBG_16_63_16]